MGNEDVDDIYIYIYMHNPNHHDDARVHDRHARRLQHSRSIHVDRGNSYEREHVEQEVLITFINKAAAQERHYHGFRSRKQRDAKKNGNQK